MTTPARVAAIVVAAGRGERAATGESAAIPKQYRPLAGVPLLSRTIAAMLDHPAIDLVLPVVHIDHADRFARLGLAHERLLPPVFGGATRQASVLAGLEALVPHGPDYVLIQDAARPFVGKPVVDAVLAALADCAGAVPVMPVTDTIKRSTDGRTVAATEDRHTLFAAQTPQGFRFAEILAAHRSAAALPRDFTDDAGIAEWAGLAVAMVPGAPGNMKITRAEDFALAERQLGHDLVMETRVGTGFDVHPFEAGTFVMLGGIRIAHPMRLVGHSDADVALHALTDAILGALGEGDIGTHFPPGDAQWRGADSALFLRHAVRLVKERHGRIVNLDLTIVCETPRIGPHVAAMRVRIGEICAIAPGRVAVKATTSEKLGFTGRGEGIVAMSAASLELPRGIE